MEGLMPLVIANETGLAAEACLEGMDGLLLTGGGDVDPFYFGEEPHPALGEVDPERDRRELELVLLAHRRDLPVLAICRGCQVLNVALGGTLYQDIESQLSGIDQHWQQGGRSRSSHSVAVQNGSLLARCFPQLTGRVNSFHHQAIRELAPALKATARSLDGIIEGVEDPVKSFVLGVQWHPEDMLAEDGARILFGLFAEAVRERKMIRESSGNTG
jgi:putative glutamine amidotransferase